MELSGWYIIAHRICGAGLARRCSSTTPLRTPSEADANSKTSIQLLDSGSPVRIGPVSVDGVDPAAASLSCEATKALVGFWTLRG